MFGILLVLTSDGAFKFSNTFVWLALALFIGALGVSHSILIPGHKKINALLLEMEQGPPPAGGPPPQVAQIQALGKRQAAAGMSLNVVLTVILVLMIWQPAEVSSEPGARLGATARGARPGLRRRAGSRCRA